MDDLQIKTRALSSLMSDVEKGKFNFDTNLQRQKNQWNRKQKSLLIDSIVRKYPIYPILVNQVNENGVYIDKYDVVDFKQRLTTIYEYYNDGFSLSKNLEPIVINGNVYDISGLTYSQLNGEIKWIFSNREIQMYIMINATDKEQREVFERINGGKPLSPCQLRTTIESKDMANVITYLTSLPFFDGVLTPAQKKKDVQKDIIRQTLMLVETNKDHDYTSFKSKDINNFIVMYQENINHSKIKTLEEAMEKLHKNFPELKVNSSSIPMILYAGYRIVKDKKTFGKLVDAIQHFIDTYDENEDYKQYCLQGSNSSTNVRGRFDYWRQVVKEI